MPLHIGRPFFRHAEAECHREVRLRKDTGSTASHQEKRRLKSAKTRWTFLLTLDGIKRSDQAALRRCHPSRLPGPFRGLVVRTLRVIGRPQQVSPDMVAVLRQAARLRHAVDTPDHESERAAGSQANIERGRAPCLSQQTGRGDRPAPAELVVLRSPACNQCRVGSGLCWIQHYTR